MDDLDKILAAQFHAASKMKTKMKAVRHFLGDDPSLVEFQKLNLARIKFFESMTSDKTLLEKRIRNKRKRSQDILPRNIIFEWSKNIALTGAISYNLIIEYYEIYLSSFNSIKKNKSDK